MKKFMICLAIMFTVATGAMAEFHTFGTSGGAFDMSDDGSVVVGLYNGEIALWTVDGGLVPIAIGDFNNTPFVSISGDGTTVAASLENPATAIYEAASWTEAGGWEYLGGLPGGGGSGNSISSSWGINGDGSTLVGLGWQDAGTAVAMQWTAAGGAGLIQNPNGESSRASAVSADGSVIVGWHGGWEGEVFWDRRPTRWVDGGVEELIMGHLRGEGVNTNADGSVIVGQALQPDSYNPTAFKYTDADGVTDLGLLVPDPYGTALSIANDISEDGTVVGWSGDDWAWDPEGISQGAVWLPDGTGMSAQAYLESVGVTVELPPGGPMGDWRIRSVMSISDDGSILAGTAVSPMYEMIGWYAVIPTFDASIECLTPVMALPDMGGFQVDVTNNSDSMIEVGLQVDVTLCSGVTMNNIRAGSTVLSVAETFTRSWTQPIPALATTCGCDLIWTLTGTDTTTLVEDIDSCTVTTTCE